MKLAFLHGLDSSPGGTKAVLLKARYPDIIIPKLPPDVEERLGIVEEVFTEPLVVVGSSLGGLTALLYSMRHPEMVKSMVLLAPAVGIFDDRILTAKQRKGLDTVYVPAGTMTTIIAGIHDEVIPLASIREMVARSPEPRDITLHEVDDDHNLHRHLDLMVSCIDDILGSRI